VKDDILYSPETSALLLAMTALQCVHGAEPRAALDRAYEIWRDHDRRSYEFSELVALVEELSSR